MATEITTPLVPPEVSENIQRLQGNVETLQRELTQALDVWKTTLEEEKKKFEELLGHKELAWQEQDTQWAKQNQVYEERLAELKADFESRLKQTEQNAARALTELDDVWQRDKLEWGPAAQVTWPQQRRELEAKAGALEERLSRIESSFKDERARLQARIAELETRPAAAESVPGLSPTPEAVTELKRQLGIFQDTVATLQDRAAHSDELVTACVQALDYQITVLHDLIYHYTPPDLGQS